MKFTPATIYTIRVNADQWDAIFAGDQRALVLANDRPYDVGNWLDLKRQHAGADAPMFAVDGVEQRLLVKVTHVIRGEQGGPLDPHFVVLSIRKL